MQISTKLAGGFWLFSFARSLAPEALRRATFACDVLVASGRPCPRFLLAPGLCSSHPSWQARGDGHYSLRGTVDTPEALPEHPWLALSTLGVPARSNNNNNNDDENVDILLEAAPVIIDDDADLLTELDNANNSDSSDDDESTVDNDETK